MSNLSRYSNDPMLPASSHTMASPSIRHERAGRAATAAAICGNRPVKSLPLRVNRRTPATSRLATMRMPSCFISCSQPGPDGGDLAVVSFALAAFLD
jgi:hypothetical protein